MIIWLKIGLRSHIESFNKDLLRQRVERGHEALDVLVRERRLREQAAQRLEFLGIPRLRRIGPELLVGVALAPGELDLG